VGILKVDIDYRDIACKLIATRNAAKDLIVSCDKIQEALDNAALQKPKQEN